MQGNELNTTLLGYIFFDFLILCVTCKRIINMYVLLYDCTYRIHSYQITKKHHQILKMWFGGRGVCYYPFSSQLLSSFKCIHVSFPQRMKFEQIAYLHFKITNIRQSYITTANSVKFKTYFSYTSSSSTQK